MWRGGARRGLGPGGKDGGEDDPGRGARRPRGEGSQAAGSNENGAPETDVSDAPRVGQPGRVLYGWTTPA